MEDLNMSAGGAFKRAVGALLLCAVGAFILIAVLSYNPFDSTGDTAGIGGVQNLLGRPGAKLSNILLQVFGWGSILAAILTLYAGIRGIVRPRPQSRDCNSICFPYPAKLAYGWRYWRLGWR